MMTLAHVYACVCVLCECVCVCVFEPTQPPQREFNYDMGTSDLKKKKNPPEFGQQWLISVCLASVKVVKRS